MRGQVVDNSPFANRFDRLRDAAEQLWRDYLAVGPGKLDQESLQPFTTALQQCHETVAVHGAEGLPSVYWQATWCSVASELKELLTRAIERPEGLCFITGEAGLIPNRLLHDRCEAALRDLQELRDQLCD